MRRGLYDMARDIDDTFISFVLFNDETGEIHINECLTTTADSSESIERGIREILDRSPKLYAAP